MPRKRFAKDSGPRKPGECHTPTGPTGGTFADEYGVRRAAEGRSATQLYRSNTALPWNQIAFAAQPHTFAQWSPSGPSGPALGSVAGIVGATITGPTGTLHEYGHATIRVTGIGYIARPPFLSDPARYWTESEGTAASAEATFLEMPYCTGPLPSQSTYSSDLTEYDNSNLYFYEKTVEIGNHAGVVATFVDAFGGLSAKASVVAGDFDRDGTRVACLMSGASVPQRFLFEPVASGEAWTAFVYTYADVGLSALQTVYTAPPQFSGSAITSIGPVFIESRAAYSIAFPRGFVSASYDIDPVSGFEFRAWRDGVEIDASGVVVSGESIDVSAITQAEGQYRLRLEDASTSTNWAMYFNYPNGRSFTAAAPTRESHLDYAVEWGWVQDFTRPRVAVRCPGSASASSPSTVELVTTEPLFNVFGNASITRNGIGIGTIPGGPPWDMRPYSFGPGKYKVAFSAGLNAFDAASNPIHPANDIEWEVYAVPTGPTGPRPPVSGSFRNVTGVADDPFDAAEVLFSSPVTGVTNGNVSLVRNGAPLSAALSVTGVGERYVVGGLAPTYQAGSSYLLSLSVTGVMPTDGIHTRVAGPVQAAWVTKATGPAQLPELDWPRGTTLIGETYAVAADADVPIFRCTGPITGPTGPIAVPYAGYRLSTPTGAQWAFQFSGDGLDQVVSSASVQAANQVVTGPSLTAAFKSPTGPSLQRLSLATGRIYEHQPTSLPTGVVEGLGHAVALTGEHRHAQWSSGQEIDSLEIEIIAEDFRQHPHYTEGAEIGGIGSLSGQANILSEYWGPAAVAGTYTLGKTIDGKSLVPCQYYFEGAGNESFVVEQAPPYVPKGYEIEATGEISLDEDWVTLYDKAVPDEPNNVSFGSEGFFIGWQSWPPSASQPTPPAPAYLSNLKLSAASALFSQDFEESREFTELVMDSTGELPYGYDEEDYNEWSELETGILADFFDEAYYGTAKTWTVTAESLQMWAIVAREVPYGVSRCGETNGALGCLRVHVRMRALYEIEIDPVRLWKTKWRARGLASYSAQDRSGITTGVTLSTEYWLLQGRRIVIDNVEENVSRTTKRERLFGFDFLLSPEEAATLESGGDVSRRFEIVHKYGPSNHPYYAHPAPQILEVRLRRPPAE